MDPDVDDDPERQGTGDRSEWSRLNTSEPGSLQRAAPTRRRTILRALPTPALALLSGMVWVGVAVGILALTGHFEPAERSVERVAEVSADDDSAEVERVPGLVASVAPSVVALRAMSPSGERFGSGVVFRPDGPVLTNAHLVEGATSISLTTDDGRSFAAVSVGSDSETDLAVLTGASAGLVPAVLGSSRGLRVGDMAVIVGARQRPQGSPSVTTGLIAGLGQVMKVGGRPIYDVISTDAPMPARASGGPLLDRQGAVVGITTRPATDGGDETEAGVVIPIDRARSVAEQLMVDGKVDYPWLGLSSTDLDLGAAAQYGVNRGTLVRDVEPESPAARGDVHVQDVVTAVEAAPIATADELTMLVRRHAPGDAIELTVVRSGTTRTLTVRLGRAPDTVPP